MDKWTNGHYVHIEKETDAEESYWQGEELRKSTHNFPEELYINLPNLLHDCMLEECTSRERDISFLSNLTALSAVLPYTFGIYNHKSYARMQIQMQDNGSQGSIIFDTEAQTLSNVNHLDCGNFDNIICKYFISIPPIRKTACALSISVIPCGHSSSPTQQVTQLYNFCLNHPAMFHFSNKQWNQLNKLFAKLLTDVSLENNDDLQAVIKRYAFLVMRISMIQTRIRQFENNDISLYNINKK